VGAKRGHLEGFINMSIFLHSPKGSMKVVKMKGEVLFAESVHFFSSGDTFTKSKRVIPGMFDRCPLYPFAGLKLKLCLQTQRLNGLTA